MSRLSIHSVLAQVVSVIAVLSVVMVLLMIEQSAHQPDMDRHIVTASYGVPCSATMATATAGGISQAGYLIVNGHPLQRHVGAPETRGEVLPAAQALATP